MMKQSKIRILAGCAFSVLLLSLATGPLPPHFTNLMDRGKMTFDKPDSLLEADITDNHQMHYGYALAYPGKHFEVRYAVRPLDSMLARYSKDTVLKKPGSFSIDPNKLYNASLQATLFNVFGGRLPVKAFNPGAVKNEFNADWGAVASGRPTGAFGAGYQSCVVVAIHKDNAADAYYFYLADSTVTRPEFGRMMKQLFHTLRFKNDMN